MSERDNPELDGYTGSTPETSEELKPCPFCGTDNIGVNSTFISKAIIVGSAFFPLIVCCECFAQTQPYRTEEEARKAWNRRPNDPS